MRKYSTEHFWVKVNVHIRPRMRLRAHGGFAGGFEGVYDEDAVGSLETELLVGNEYCFFIYII